MLRLRYNDADVLRGLVERGPATAVDDGWMPLFRYHSGERGTGILLARAPVKNGSLSYRL